MSIVEHALASSPAPIHNGSAPVWIVSKSIFPIRLYVDGADAPIVLWPRERLSLDTHGQIISASAQGGSVLVVQEIAIGPNCGSSSTDRGEDGPHLLQVT